MAILYFDKSVRNALAHGFMKGLTAPVTLFAHESAPPVPTLPQVKVPGNGPQLIVDGKKTTMEIYYAIERNGKKQGR